MKKYIFLVLLFSIFINTKPKEDVVPIIKNNEFIGIENIIEIESNKKKIKVESKAIQNLLAYTSINKNDKYKIKIRINSKEYKYKKETIKLKKIKYDKTKTIYRTINKPLKKLYNNKNINLEDKVLDKKLKLKGYKGIEDLDEYYKDYYKCNKLTDNEIKKIIKGEQTYIKESNDNINKLAYNYYYKYVFIIKNKDLNLEISLNDNYYTNAYENYLYDMKLLLYLKKIE